MNLYDSKINSYSYQSCGYIIFEVFSSLVLLIDYLKIVSGFFRWGACVFEKSLAKVQKWVEGQDCLD